MVSIGPLTRTALLRWREQSKDTSPHALMFPSKKGTPISSRNFRNRVLLPIQQKLNQELCKQGKAELNAPLSFQVLRRSQAMRNQRRLKMCRSTLGTARL
jgi:site-specific recombinase XerC